MRLKLRIFILVVGLALLALSSCRCIRGSKADATTADSSWVEIEVAEINPYWTSISFISRGSGVSTSAIDSVNALIAGFIENGSLVKEEYAWGREGERDYCLLNISLSPQDEKELMAHLTGIALNDSLVFISDECTHRR